MGKTPTELRVERLRYPNGSYFYRVHLGDENVGSFDRRGDGYVVTGCRKAFPSIEVATREAIWKRIQRAIKDAARYSAALDLPVNADAVAGKAE